MVLLQDQQHHQRNNNGQTAFGTTQRQIAYGFAFGAIIACLTLVAITVAVAYPNRFPFRSRATPNGNANPAVTAVVGGIEQGAESTLPSQEVINAVRGKLPEGDFALLTTPDIKSTKSDSTITYDLRIVRTDQFHDPITITAANLPTGVTVASEPATVAADADSAALRLTVPADAASGSYSFSIFAKALEKERTASAALAVSDLELRDLHLVEVKPMDKGTLWQATVAWTTDAPSNTWIEYATDASFISGNQSYSFTNVEHVNTIAHSTTLLYLEPGTLYHFRIRSVDGLNNVSVSSDRVFVTRTE